MSELFPLVIEESFVAALVALKPISYVIRIGVAVVAFGAAMNVERVVWRVIGMVWLLLTGLGLVWVGFQNGTVVDILLGLVGVGAAGYSWWFTRG